MKNLWPEKFEESSAPSPSSFLDEQAKLLSTLTNGIIFAEVGRLEGMEEIGALHRKHDFIYSFVIVGKFIGDYRFRVCTFGHDITMYPVTFRFDEDISKELGVTEYPNELEITSHEQMEPLLKKVLGSKKMQKVVGSILRLSRAST